ncbi:unnamed protein product [Lactuca saligna]|uniref:Uncharacterized protein n=1 Tax=Lactuca saligna TaxID=75948 RepID=A0AA35YTZ6_LACSI|nr:unnamed protein product [Lactuca saligna]
MTFFTTDPRNFDFVGSIPEVVMEKVPLNNVIIKAYQKLPLFGVRKIPFYLKKIIEVGGLLKRGGKRKTKEAANVVATVSKKIKKLAKKPKLPPHVFEDNSEERTYSDVQGEGIIRNYEDDSSTNIAVPIV